MIAGGSNFPVKFLSTPSARRATFNNFSTAVQDVISIHALREEGDWSSCAPGWKAWYFYPRPPRGGRRFARSLWSIPCVFLSTPSARRATNCIWGGKTSQKISIHALREEGDGLILLPRLGDKNFYPRPPRGGRHEHRRPRNRRHGISIHALREEGDMFHGASSCNGSISIHALREEGDSEWGKVKTECKSISIHALREEGDPNCPLDGFRQLISIHALREEGDMPAASTLR